jgi:hypothetical protein
MPDAVKGGLFVGAAVAAGLLAGLLIVAGRGTADGSRADSPPLPTMPTVIGRPLDEAQRTLSRRGIRYMTDAPEIVEVTVPGILEVCESDPAPRRSIRGRARLHVSLAGTCGI